jgi:HD-GYP domain-containing protein (c-di-GMP phosphodiesterase class II)
MDSNNRDVKKIPLGARIVAVVDAFDAMTTDRPYRKGMPPWEALQELVEKSGKQFDPGVVEAFKRVIGERMERV